VSDPTLTKRLRHLAHCKAGKIAKAKSNRMAKGKVVSQTPKAGTKLAAGAKVNLVVSRGTR